MIEAEGFEIVARIIAQALDMPERRLAAVGSSVEDAHRLSKVMVAIRKMQVGAPRRVRIELLDSSEVTNYVEDADVFDDELRVSMPSTLGSQLPPLGHMVLESFDSKELFYRTGYSMDTLFDGLGSVRVEA